MYKCELCTTARFSVVDKGEAWFIDCGSCRSLQFHHKVILKVKDRAMNYPIDSSFYCKMDKELEKEDK